MSARASCFTHSHLPPACRSLCPLFPSLLLRSGRCFRPLFPRLRPLHRCLGPSCRSHRPSDPTNQLTIDKRQLSTLDCQLLTAISSWQHSLLCRGRLISSLFPHKSTVYAPSCRPARRRQASPSAASPMPLAAPFASPTASSLARIHTRPSP
ncbi:unnamed protein product [Protopolystoma xenopodis]|uniref:Uncharacterized protein n=1 Tax=Protopolystoma xenopodis TaxID=117903 RepID=A0A448X709_9PLAT|nr:unnamed protein product [Protopolystoma xenopodis]